MDHTAALIVNVAEAPEERWGDPVWGGVDRILTPGMRERGGRLGVVQVRLPQGHVGCPFHLHTREDEVFFVLSGRGVLRYGDHLYELRAGDCVSCPAGTGLAHQIANPHAEDLVYLAIGDHDPHEVCAYPDTGKIFARALKKVGFFTQAEYMAGEPSPPKILEMIARQGEAPADGSGEP